MHMLTWVTEGKSVLNCNKPLACMLMVGEQLWKAVVGQERACYAHVLISFCTPCNSASAGAPLLTAAHPAEASRKACQQAQQCGSRHAHTSLAEHSHGNLCQEHAMAQAASWKHLRKHLRSCMAS